VGLRRYGHPECNEGSRFINYSIPRFFALLRMTGCEEIPAAKIGAGMTAGNDKWRASNDMLFFYKYI
jgi:hypothetical protein